MKLRWPDVHSRLRHAFAAARKITFARAAAPLHIVACRPLYGGGALYVADVDGRRLVFVAGQRTACLLTQYEAPRCAEGTR